MGPLAEQYLNVRQYGIFKFFNFNFFFQIVYIIRASLYDQPISTA